MKAFAQTHKTFFLSIGFLVLFSITVSFATPPGSPYPAGGTLDPSCAPGSSNCTVTASGLTTGTADARYPQLSGSYANPSWLASIPFSKLTSTPTTLSGYGISDAYTKTQSDGNYLSVLGGTITGTNGAGFIGLAPQASVPSTPTSGVKIYARSTGGLSWIGTNGLTRTIVGTNLTADRTYSLPDADVTLVGDSNTQTISGAKTFSTTPLFSSLTTGSVPYITAGGQISQDNANLYWDSLNHRLGIGTTNPRAALEVNGDIIAKGPQVDVRAYGAVADGVTDNTSAYNAAMAAMPSTGGVLYFPPGVWKGQILLTKNDITILGSGQPMYNDSTQQLEGGTILRGAIDVNVRIGSAVLNLGIDQTNETDANAISALTPIISTPLNQRFENLTLLGRGYTGVAPATSAHGILLETGTHDYLNNIKVYKFGHGLAIKTSYTNISNIYTQDTDLDSVIIRSDSTHPDVEYVNVSNVIGKSVTAGKISSLVALATGVGSITKHLNFTNYSGYNSGQYGVYFQGEGTISDINLTNASVYNSTASGIDINNATNVTITNAQVTNSASYSFRNDGTGDVQITQSTSTNPALGDFLGPFKKLNIDNVDYTPLTLASSASGFTQFNTVNQTSNYEKIMGQYQSNVWTLGSYFTGSGTGRSIQIGVQPNSALSTLLGGRVFTINNSPSVSAGNFDFSNTTATAGSMVTVNTGITSSSAQQNMFSIQGTVAQSGSGSYSGLYISPFESSVGSGTKYLIQAGVNSATANGGTHTNKFTVDDVGNVVATNFNGVAITSGGSASQFLTAAGTYASVSAAPAGSTGNIQFNSAGSFGADSGLVWDNTNKRLGVGVASPLNALNVASSTLTASTEVLPFRASESSTGAGVVAGYFTNGAGNGVLEARIRSTGGIPLALGTTLFSQALYILNTNGNVGIGTTTPSGILTIGGNRSATAWGLNGINFQTLAATYTDSSTGASTTVTNNMANTLGIPTLAASNTAVTYTNAATLYIAGAPTAGTNVTITNPYALYVVGNALFSNGATFAAATTFNSSISVGSASGNLQVPTASTASHNTGAMYQFGGSTGSTYRTELGGTNTFAMTIGDNYANTLVGSSPITTPASGTNTLLANMVVNPIGTVTAGGATITNTASLYVGGASTSGTNNYAFWVASGLSQFGSSSVTTGTTVATFQNAGGTCNVIPSTSGGISCSSDMNLKKNITTLADNSSWSYSANVTPDNRSVLAKILALTPVDYNWNVENDTDAKHAGFIAQEVRQVFPDLVSEDSKTHLLSLNYAGMMPYTVEAIKEMNVTMKAIPTFSDATVAQRLNDFLKNVAENGFGVFTKVKTSELCVDDVCVTRDQFKQMVQGTGTNGSAPMTTTVTSPTVTDTPPADSSPASDATQTPEVQAPAVTAPSTDSVPVIPSTEPASADPAS
jgi:hypothetical protein